jgi:hypothetical protein
MLLLCSSTTKLYYPFIIMRPILLLLGLSTFSLWAEGFQSTPRLQHATSRPISAHLNNANDSHRTSTELSALFLSQENIVNAFSVATFLPQPFWVLLTILPNNKLTKKIMGGMGA